MKIDYGNLTRSQLGAINLKSYFFSDGGVVQVDNRFYSSPYGNIKVDDVKSGYLGMVIVSNGYLGKIKGVDRYSLTLRFNPRYSDSCSHQGSLEVRGFTLPSIEMIDGMVGRAIGKFASELVN